MERDVNVESWLRQVALSHSGSRGTELSYRLALVRFIQSVGKTAEQVIREYESLPEKTFKRYYTQSIVDFVFKEKQRGLSSGSFASSLYAVRSFFKYNSLPLNFIPTVNVSVENHNRDIQREEIAEVLRLSEFRERAFYCLMAQSGLRPDTLTRLRIRDVEGILEENTSVPALISVPKESTKGHYGGYFTFCGQESITYLKEYFKTRPKALTLDAYVFVMVEEDKPAKAGVFSHLFRRAVLSLQRKNVLKVKTQRKNIAVETTDGKPLRSYVTRNDLRLYNLRKFFRKFAGQAGVDYVNFWMGHLSAMGVDLSYFSRDVEMHRTIYKEKAMPHLRLESHTPTETEKEIETLRTENEKLHSEIETMKSDFETMKNMINIVSPALIELYRKNLAENPEQEKTLLKETEKLKSSLFKKKEQEAQKD